MKIFILAAVLALPMFAQATDPAKMYEVKCYSHSGELIFANNMQIDSFEKQASGSAVLLTGKALQYDRLDLAVSKCEGKDKRRVLLPVKDLSLLCATAHVEEQLFGCR